MAAAHWSQCYRQIELHHGKILAPVKSLGVLPLTSMGSEFNPMPRKTCTGSRRGGAAPGSDGQGTLEGILLHLLKDVTSSPPSTLSGARPTRHVNIGG